MSMPPPPPGYGTLPPDPNDPYRGAAGGQPPGQPPVGPPPPMPYPQGGPPGRTGNARTLGIISVIAGAVGIPFACCCWFIGWLPALVAIGTGIAGLSQLKHEPDSDAKPFLIAGIVLGVAGLALVVLSLVFGFANAIYNEY